VVPSSRGGCDRWGWDPSSDGPVSDLAREANRLHRNRDILRLNRASPELHLDAEGEKAEALRLAEMNDKEIITKFAPTMDEDGPFEPIGRMRVLRASDGRPLALEQAIRLKKLQTRSMTAAHQSAVNEAAAMGDAVTEDDE